MHVQVLFADSNFENPVTLYAGLQKLVIPYVLVKYKPIILHVMPFSCTCHFYCKSYF